jgi:hypothetical protein
MLIGLSKERHLPGYDMEASNNHHQLFPGLPRRLPNGTLSS